jgi:nitroreductase
MGTEGFMVALTSIFWRESWKYGERGFRYCNHDVGHALACLSFSANLQGWKVKCLNGLSDEEVHRILGFHKVDWMEEEEEEHPEIICFICSNEAPDIPRRLPPDIVSTFSDLHFSGKPNVLSRETFRWEAIREVARHTFKPATPEKKYRYGAKEPER